MTVQRTTVARPLAEVTAMAGLLASYIWVWGNTFRWDFTLCVALYLAIGLASHIRAGESAAEIGIQLENVGASARDALVVTIPIVVALLAAGALLGSFDFPPVERWPRVLLRGIAWGGLQQYGLLCVFYRRFAEMLPGHRGSLLAASAVFGLLHLPNPFLTAATFGAGVLSCWLYRRAPNLIVLGVMHGVISFVMTRSLPDVLTMGMRVGPGFLDYRPGQ